MVYIFYGSNYQENYNKGFIFAQKKSKFPIIINENNINYNKEDIELFLYYFSLPASEDSPNVIIIEHPEHINELLIQSFLLYFENLPPFHIIILITDQLQKIQKTIISRSILILNELNENRKSDLYTIFIEELENNKLINISIEEIIDRNNITGDDTINISILLLKKYYYMKNDINKILKYYLPFIKNGHYQYWKMIYLLLHKK